MKVTAPVVSKLHLPLLLWLLFFQFGPHPALALDSHVDVQVLQDVFDAHVTRKGHLLAPAVFERNLERRGGLVEREEQAGAADVGRKEPSVHSLRRG